MMRFIRWPIAMHRFSVLLLVIWMTGCVSYDQTRGKPSVCEVHNIQMTKQAVRVVPGIAASNYKHTPYPHAKRAIVAGCTVSEQTGYIYVCSECERIWRGAGGSEERGPFVPSKALRDSWPKTLDEAVTRLVAGMSEADRATVRETPKEKLILFLRDWGMGIRNDFGLWRRNTNLLADCHTDDPEGASMVIIESVWKRLQKP